jgi:hypothetical protein
MESCELAHSVVGTPLYMSPELCLSRPYDHKSDVWALGGVLYELTSLRRPFSAQGFAQLIMSVLRGRCAPIPLQARLPPLGTAVRPRVGSCGAAKRHSCARKCACELCYLLGSTRPTSSSRSIFSDAQSRIRSSARQSMPSSTSLSSRRAAHTLPPSCPGLTRRSTLPRPAAPHSEPCRRKAGTGGTEAELAHTAAEPCATAAPALLPIRPTPRCADGALRFRACVTSSLGLAWPGPSLLARLPPAARGYTAAAPRMRAQRQLAVGNRHDLGHIRLWQWRVLCASAPRIRPSGRPCVTAGPHRVRHVDVHAHTCVTHIGWLL